MEKHQINVKNTTLESSIKLILLGFACIIGFGLIPGFFFAAIIDCFIPLKGGPIWATTLLFSGLIIFLFYLNYSKDLVKTLKRYLTLSLLLLVAISILSLFFQGDIFFQYTYDKMVPEQGIGKGAKYFNQAFEKAEIERGRLDSTDVKTEK